MKITHKYLPALFAVLVVFFISSNFANAATMLDLGTLSGSDYSDAFDISDDGSIVVGRAPNGTPSSYYNVRAFKYQNGIMTNIGTLSGDTNATPYGISGNGLIIVGHGDSHAFKYDGTTMTDLGTLPGDVLSYASSASYDGSVIVGNSIDSSSSYSRAFKYSGGVMTDLGNLGGSTYAYGVSNDGSVIVGDSNNLAFKYVGGTISSLGTLGGTYSSANGISGNGLTIVGSSKITGDSATHAFKYVGTTMTDLGTLGGTNSYAYSVSNDGSVIVGQSDASGDTFYHAFKYVDGSMIDIGTLGGNNAYAYAVSADGKTIAGTSQIADGTYHAFIYSTASTSLVDVNNTYSSLYYNGAQLHSLMNLKNSLLKYSLVQDCNKFGANNMCISLGYRYANTNNYNAQESATNLKLAYRVSPNFRVGVLLDQAFSSSDPQNFTVKNSQPLFGIFTNFSQNPDETGLNLKMSAAYHNSKMSVRRNALTNTEAGSGSTNLKSSGLLAELSYVAKASERLQIKPFASMRQTEISRDAFTETSGADFPITFEAVKQKFTTAILGIRSSFDLTKSVGLTFGTGMEYNIRSRVDGYSGYISQIGSFSLNSPNTRKTTAFVEGGVNYEISDSKRLSGSINYSSQALNTANVAMFYINYSVGF